MSGAFRNNPNLLEDFPTRRPTRRHSLGEEEDDYVDAEEVFQAQKAERKQSRRHRHSSSRSHTGAYSSSRSTGGLSRNKSSRSYTSNRSTDRPKETRRSDRYSSSRSFSGSSSRSTDGPKSSRRSDRHSASKSLSGSSRSRDGSRASRRSNRQSSSKSLTGSVSHSRSHGKLDTHHEERWKEEYLSRREMLDSLAKQSSSPRSRDSHSPERYTNEEGGGRREFKQRLSAECGIDSDRRETTDKDDGHGEGLDPFDRAPRSASDESGGGERDDPHVERNNRSKQAKTSHRMMDNGGMSSLAAAAAAGRRSSRKIGEGSNGGAGDVGDLFDKNAGKRQAVGNSSREETISSLNNESDCGVTTGGPLLLSTFESPDMLLWGSTGVRLKRTDSDNEDVGREEISPKSNCTGVVELSEEASWRSQHVSTSLVDAETPSPDDSRTPSNQIVKKSDSFSQSSTASSTSATSGVCVDTDRDRDAIDPKYLGSKGNTSGVGLCSESSDTKEQISESVGTAEGKASGSMSEAVEETGMEVVRAEGSNSIVIPGSNPKDIFADAELLDSQQPPLPTAHPTTPTNKATPSERSPVRKSKNKPSFTADSPYFTSYVDKEMRNLVVLTETLRDVSARAKTFGKCGALMAEATRRLSLACKLHPSSSPVSGGEDANDEEAKEKEKSIIAERRESVGEEMGSVLTVLGEVLDEVADAQVQMCESLEASLSLSLEAFAGLELQEATRLRSEAEVMTESAEDSFSKYLNGKNAERSTNDDQLQNVAGSWNKLSDQVGGQILKTWGRGSSSDEKGINERRGRRGNSGGGERDSAFSTAATAANLRLNLEQIRLAQANAELKRFQLLKKLDSLKTRRNFELGESALASLHGIRAYFHHCSDLIQGLTPRLHKLQAQQGISRENHEKQQIPWEERQKGLAQAISDVGIAAANAGVIADAISRGQGTGLGQSMIADQPTSLEEVESEVKLWELPQLLAESTLYQRNSTPGVIVEGWLYKKSTSRMTLNTWNKRWFILDKTGVYYFRGGALKTGNNSAETYLNSLERVKVCDIVLCTVREVKEKAKDHQGYRFCFEILSPNSKPLMLQARGPLEFRKWVESIRSCIERQLVHGSVPPDEFLMKPGKGKTIVNKRWSDSDAEGENADGDGGNQKGSGDEVQAVDGDEGRRTSPNGLGLEGTQPHFRKYDEEESLSSPRGSISGDSSHGSLKPRSPLVRKILEANPYCADCGMPSPDWASLNVGVLLCIECGGVHRSLGVHVSKVRSVRLDTISDSEARLILALGNDRANSIWEAGVGSQKGWRKPRPEDNRQTKEEWIKSKYLWRGFLEYNAEDGREEGERRKKFSLDLYEAARLGRVFDAAKAYVKGGDVEWHNEKQGGKTPLHICAVGSPSVAGVRNAGEWQGIECAEYLLQNGAKMDAEDSHHQGVLDCAVCGNAQREMVEYLSARIAS